MARNARRQKGFSGGRDELDEDRRRLPESDGIPKVEPLSRTLRPFADYTLATANVTCG
jgi:hypothetical protein